MFGCKGPFRAEKEVLDGLHLESDPCDDYLHFEEDDDFSVEVQASFGLEILTYPPDFPTPVMLDDISLNTAPASARLYPYTISKPVIGRAGASSSPGESKQADHPSPVAGSLFYPPLTPNSQRVMVDPRNLSPSSTQSGGLVVDTSQSPTVDISDSEDDDESAVHTPISTVADFAPESASSLTLQERIPSAPLRSITRVQVDCQRDELRPTLAERVKGRARRYVKTLEQPHADTAPQSSPSEVVVARPRRRSGRQAFNTLPSSFSSAGKAIDALLDVDPDDDKKSEAGSEDHSDATSDFEPSNARQSAARGGKKPRKGCRPRGRDPKRRRTQNVQSQKKYRDKRKELAKIDHLAMTDFCALIQDMPPSKARTRMIAIRQEVVRRYEDVLDEDSRDLLRLREEVDH